LSTDILEGVGQERIDVVRGFLKLLTRAKVPPDLLGCEHPDSDTTDVKVAGVLVFSARATREGVVGSILPRRSN
jgi:hypothetical protein